MGRHGMQPVLLLDLPRWNLQPLGPLHKNNNKKTGRLLGKETTAPCDFEKRERRFPDPTIADRPIQSRVPHFQQRLLPLER